MWGVNQSTNKVTRGLTVIFKKQYNGSCADQDKFSRVCVCGGGGSEGYLRFAGGGGNQDIFLVILLCKFINKIFKFSRGRGVQIPLPF